MASGMAEMTVSAIDIWMYWPSPVRRWCLTADRMAKIMCIPVRWSAQIAPTIPGRPSL